MIAVEQLQEWLLQSSRQTNKRRRQQILALVLDEIQRASTAIEILDQLFQLRKELDVLITAMCEKVTTSYQWDIWAFYPLERIEGP